MCTEVLVLVHLVLGLSFLAALFHCVAWSCPAALLTGWRAGHHHHHHLPLTNPPLLEGGGEPTNEARAACCSSNGAALSICAAAAPTSLLATSRATDVPINLKYSQAGLQHRRRGLSRISEALERKGSIWWPVPSCCSKDLLNNPGWIADPVVSRRLYKSGLEWQSYLASSTLQNIA